MKHIKLFEQFINEAEESHTLNEANPNYGKPEPGSKNWKIGRLSFKHTQRDNPDEDLLIGRLDKNHVAMYSLHVKTGRFNPKPGNEIPIGTERLYILGGKAYVNGADEDTKNIYDIYDVNEIPKEYMWIFKELKDTYWKKYAWEGNLRPDAYALKHDISSLNPNS